MTQEAFWLGTQKLRRRYNRLWLADHFARTFVRRETRWTKRRLEVHEELVELAVGLGGQRAPVDRVKDIAPAEFKRRYLDTDTPVVIEGAGREWPAAGWTPQMIGERYANTTVRLLRLAPGEPKGKPGQGRDASYAEIARSMETGGDLYARFSGIMHQHPELVDDLDVEWFRAMRHGPKQPDNWKFFMGGAKTASGMHNSIAPNLFYQITGEKRWFIYPAKAGPLFSPIVRCSPYFYSEVDVSDAVTWPIAEATPGWITDLTPGDVLFVPSFAWHQVYNFSPTLAVGYRWLNARLGWRASPIQTTLVLTSSNPPVWKAKGLTDLPAMLDSVEW